MSLPRKHYCPNCQNRVSRSARRCPFCGRFLLTWRLIRDLIIILALVCLAVYLVLVLPKS